MGPKKQIIITTDFVDLVGEEKGNQTRQLLERISNQVDANTIAASVSDDGDGQLIVGNDVTVNLGRNAEEVNRNLKDISNNLGDQQ